MPVRHFVTITAFCLASVVNPAYFAGCTSSSGDEPRSRKFEFGEADMLTLLDEANATSPFDFTSGLDRYRLEISFEQRSGEDQDDTAALQQRSAFMSRVAACGTRTFMSSAAACITLSRMPLTATIDVYRIDSDGLTTVVQSRTLDAYLSVDGYELTNAQIFSGSYGVGQTNTRLSLSSADGKTFRLAQFSIVDAGLSLEADTM